VRASADRAQFTKQKIREYRHTRCADQLIEPAKRKRLKGSPLTDVLNFHRDDSGVSI
jgi:hypothetical protein